MVMLCNSNCTLWLSEWNTTKSFPHITFEGNPDIAGTGVIFPHFPLYGNINTFKGVSLISQGYFQVISSFVASAFISLCLLAANIVFIASSSKAANRIDNQVFTRARSLRLFIIKDAQSKFWIPVIEKVLLNLSDQQLLTGLAVLIASFVTHCSISVYHFSLAGELAWFSATVHLATLDVLQHHIKHRPFTQHVRAILMICLAILLLASTVLQAHEAWYESWTYGAQCLFDDLVGNISGLPAFWMSFGLVFIVLYLIAVSALYETPSRFIDKWLIIFPEQYLATFLEHYERRLSRTSNQGFIKAKASQLHHLVAVHCIRMALLVHVIGVSLSASRCVGFLTLLAWFSISLYSILDSRLDSTSITYADEDETNMTFGQIVSIFLLCSTLFAFRGAYDGIGLIVSRAES